jgi:hypothetical protein
MLALLTCGGLLNSSPPHMPRLLGSASAQLMHRVFLCLHHVDRPLIE